MGSTPASPAIFKPIRLRLMKKWVGSLISLFLVVALGLGFVWGKMTLAKGPRLEDYRLVPAQEEKEKGEADPHMLQILKEIQKKLDGWLKSLNERIESEDVSRFEVRFLEMIRNILEWVKEKVDAKIESYEKETPKKKPKRDLFRETNRRFLPLSKMG